MKRVLIAILAAGDSRRMGHPKLCLPWGRTSILGHIIDCWREAGASDLLVVQPRSADTPVGRELDRLAIPPQERAVTFAPEWGMMGSVVTAARHAAKLEGLSHLIITLGDQPQVRAGTLRAMLSACDHAPDHIVRPLFEGRTGHPCALPANMLPSLSTTTAATLREFLNLQARPVADFECDDSGVVQDIDTPTEYAKAAATQRLA